MVTASYEEALCVFRDLCEDTVDEGFDNEYVRGGAELIGDLFGVVGVPLAERKNEILADLRRIPCFANYRELHKYGISYSPIREVHQQ